MAQAFIEYGADVTQLRCVPDLLDAHGGLALFVPEVQLVALVGAVGVLLPRRNEVPDGVGDVTLYILIGDLMGGLCVELVKAAPGPLTVPR